MSSFFQIPTLQKVVVSSNLGQLTEIKCGLVLGLQVRSSLPPLKKITLGLESAHSYKMRDFQMLCDALFSLPQLASLKVILGKGFTDMI